MVPYGLLDSVGLDSDEREADRARNGSGAAAGTTIDGAAVGTTAAELYRIEGDAGMVPGMTREAIMLTAFTDGVEFARMTTGPPEGMYADAPPGAIGPMDR